MRASSVILTVLALVQACVAVKYRDLVDTYKKVSPLKINDANFESILEQPREDFDLVLLATATNPEVGCALCHEYGPMFGVVAESFATNWDGSTDKALVFAIADFPTSRKLFQKMKLNAVPKLFYYKSSATGNVLGMDAEYSFMQSENPANLAAWVHAQSRLPQHFFIIHEKVDYSNMALTVAAIAMLIFLTYKKRAEVGRLLKSKGIWQAASIILIILFVSGHMYNEIRGAPFSRPARDGSVEYFAPGHQQQYAAETQFVSVVYGLLMILTVVVLGKVQAIKNPKIAFAVTVMSALAIYTAYSYLIHLFHKKNSGYPYHLMKF